MIGGCGLSGAVTARYLAEEINAKVLVVDKRDHIGGNCYDYVDQNGIRINKYGAHLFHTNNERVWKYINRFSDWTRWEHSVLGLIDGRYVPLPPNITTINLLCQQNIKSQIEADEWLSETQVKHESIENGFQMATSRVGIELYEKIFKHYTYKQWAKYPDELDASVLARIPVRNNFDARYFSDKYQVLPTHGYTNFFENILKHPNIEVKLSCDFNEIYSTHKDVTAVYTGPIDTYYADTGLPKLEYRSINFNVVTMENMNFYQPCAIVNHPGPDKEYTRVVEYKHFLNQKSPNTTIVYETTTGDGDPYYPVPNKRNTDLYETYRQLAEKETNIHFLGRLAGYKYFNMDEAIENALQYCERNFHKEVKVNGGDESS